MRKFLIFSIFLLSSLCLQANVKITEASGRVESIDVYHFPNLAKQDDLYKSVWTENFDKAVLIAQEQNKLLVIVFTNSPNKFFGNDAFACWQDDELKKYIEENFICVMLSVKYTEHGMNPNSTKFAERHLEVKKLLNPNQVPDLFVYDPKTGKYERSTPHQKTAIGFMDDFEIVKEKLIKGYQRKKLLSNPDARRSVSDPTQPIKYGIKIGKVPFDKKTRRSTLEGWSDDFEKAAENAKKNDKMVLVWYCTNIEEQIKRSKSLNTPEFKDFAKKNFECVKINTVFKEDFGIYKYIRDLPEGKTKAEQKQIEIIKKLNLDCYPMYIIYDPISGKNERTYGPDDLPEDRLAELQLQTMKLKEKRGN